MITNYQLRPAVHNTTFVPDQLIAGNLKLITQDVAFSQGDTPLIRGTIVGAADDTGLYKICTQTATDGSQIPLGVVVDTIDVTTGETTGSIYEMGEFNLRYMTADPSWDESALITACRKSQLYIKRSVSNDII